MKTSPTQKILTTITVLMALMCATQLKAQTILRLAWVTEPGAIVYGSTFSPKPVIETVGQNNHFTTVGLTNNVTLTITLTSGTGTLIGTTNYNIGTSGSNGVVSLNDLAIVGGTGNNYQLTASIPGQGPFAGMSLWFDANATNSLVVNSTNGVTGWTNQGFFGGSLVVPAGNANFGSPPFYAPTFVANSMNGRPVVRFSTASTGPDTDPGQGLENRWTGLNTSTNIHVFFVARQPSDPPGNWSGIFGFGNEAGAAGKEHNSLGEDSGWSTTGFRIFRDDQDTSPSYSNPGQFTLPNYPTTGIGANNNETALGAWYNERPSNNSAYVNEFLFDGSINAGIDDWQDQNGNLWTNFQVSTVAYGNFNITDFALGGQLGLAGAANSPAADELDWPINVDIAEVLMYTNRLPDSARAQILNYLQSKWLNPADQGMTFPFMPGASVASTSFTVSPATVTITNGITANSKLYNGNTADTLTIGTVELSGVVAQDVGNVSVNTSGATATFANIGPGNNIPVTVTGLTLTGSAAGFYTLAPLVLSANITPLIAPFNAFKITAASGSVTAGSADLLTISTMNANGTVNTAVDGDITVTFSGLSASPSGVMPTVTDYAGTPRAFGTPMVLFFTNGVASTSSGASSLVPYDAQTASPHISGVTNTDADMGGSTMAVTVSPGSDHAYRITAATTTPAAGAADTLTIHIADQYGNQTSTSGNKTITFGGLSNAPNGSSPTVNGTAFGTGTTISFTGGSVTATLVAVKVENNKQLTATDGTLTAAATGGTAPLFSPVGGPAAKLGITTQPSTPDTAGVAFATQPVVGVFDAYLNAVSSTASTSASAAVGNLNGTTPISAVAGVASFSGLSLNNAGPNTLTFTSTGLTPVTSAQIIINPGRIVAAAWIVQPGNATVNTAFGTQPVLATVDQYGNPSTNGLPVSVPVTVTKTAGPGALSGTTSYDIGTTSDDGVIHFTDLSLNAVSNNFILTAEVQLPASATLPVDGAAVWLDANDSSTIVGTSPVTQWKDKSGNNHNFSKAAGRGTVTYANNIDGRPVVTFTNAALLTPDGAFSFTGDSMTLFCVARHSTNAFTDFEGPVSSTSGSNDWSQVGSWSIDANLGASPSPRYQRYGGVVTSPTALNPGTPFIWEGAFDGSSAFEYVGYDGLTASNITGLLANLDAGTPFNVIQLAVGARFQSSDQITNPWDGDIGEVVLDDSFLSSNDQAQVYSYLYNKWIGNGAAVAVSTAVFSVGTAPINSAEHIGLGGGHVSVSFNGAANTTYILQRSTNLDAGVGAGWVNIFTNASTSNTVFKDIDAFHDIGSAPPNAYYRYLVP